MASFYDSENLGKLLAAINKCTTPANAFKQKFLHIVFKQEMTSKHFLAEITNQYRMAFISLITLGNTIFVALIPTLVFT